MTKKYKTLKVNDLAKESVLEHSELDFIQMIWIVEDFFNSLFEYECTPNGCWISKDKTIIAFITFSQLEFLVSKRSVFNSISSEIISNLYSSVLTLNS